MIQKSKPPPGNEKILHQLERMLGSPDFNASSQQTAFLKFLINRTLAGDADHIKGYTVATEVFGRGPDFDQSIDPVVSIQAGRLRRAIERYYLTAGKNDSIRIEIPMGTYVPAFSERLPSHRDIAAEQAATSSGMETWPNVLVKPLANLTENLADEFVAIGLTKELAHALCQYREIRILEALDRDPESTPRNSDVGFTIDGSVCRDSVGITAAIKLCDAKKCLQIWSGKYEGDFEAAQMIAFQEKVAAEVAERVAGDNFNISKHLAGISRNKAVPKLTTYEAMLRFWESDTLLTPQSMKRAIYALEHAVAQEPDYGQTWSMLAAQYADNYGVEFVDLPTPLEKAVEYAQKGVRLDPTNRRARMILAYVRLMENKLQEARYEAETAYRLCPNSIMVLDAIGWLMALTGEWERGVNWVKKAMQLNPYYRPWAHYAVFLNWFRQGIYEKAYRETLNFGMPDLYWEQLLKASTCGHLGKFEEGQTYLRTLLELKPDFAQRGRILIGRYIKFEEIVDQLLAGLNAVGLAVR